MTEGNDDFIRCWTEILVPKWIKFRHILSGNGATHSKIAYEHFGISEGDKILDIGCGFGETSIAMGKRVGPKGEVLGLDCTQSFLDIAKKETEASGLTNVRYQTGDAQIYELEENYYDILHSRFGVMFFQSAVAALRNTAKSLKPGGKLCLIVWRTLDDNPCWGVAKEIALKYLPLPGDGKATCGPGPFSWANEETDRAMLKAAGFPEIELFKRTDADAFMGGTLDEAIDFQLLVGPSGEIIREAGQEGEKAVPQIRKDLAEFFALYKKSNGYYVPSSTWVIMAHKN